MSLLEEREPARRRTPSNQRRSPNRRSPAPRSFADDRLLAPEIEPLDDWLRLRQEKQHAQSLLSAHVRETSAVQLQLQERVNMMQRTLEDLPHMMEKLGKDLRLNAGPHHEELITQLHDLFDSNERTLKHINNRLDVQDKIIQGVMAQNNKELDTNFSQKHERAIEHIKSIEVAVGKINAMNNEPESYEQRHTMINQNQRIMRHLELLEKALDVDTYEGETAHRPLGKTKLVPMEMTVNEPSPSLGVDIHWHRVGDAYEAQVEGVKKGGPFHQAGVERGDVIEVWDGQEITSKEEFHRQLESYAVGEPTEFKIRRAIGAPETIHLNIGPGTVRPVKKVVMQQVKDPDNDDEPVELHPKNTAIARLEIKVKETLEEAVDCLSNARTLRQENEEQTKRIMKHVTATVLQQGRNKTLGYADPTEVELATFHRVMQGQNGAKHMILTGDTLSMSLFPVTLEELTETYISDMARLKNSSLETLTIETGMLRGWTLGTYSRKLEVLGQLLAYLDSRKPFGLRLTSRGVDPGELYVMMAHKLCDDPEEQAFCIESLSGADGAVQFTTLEGVTVLASGMGIDIFNSPVQFPRTSYEGPQGTRFAELVVRYLNRTSNTNDDFPFPWILKIPNTPPIHAMSCLDADLAQEMVSNNDLPLAVNHATYDIWQLEPRKDLSGMSVRPMVSPTFDMVIVFIHWSLAFKGGEFTYDNLVCGSPLHDREPATDDVGDELRDRDGIKSEKDRYYIYQHLRHGGPDWAAIFAKEILPGTPICDACGTKAIASKEGKYPVYKELLDPYENPHPHMRWYDILSSLIMSCTKYDRCNIGQRLCLLDLLKYCPQAAVVLVRTRAECIDVQVGMCDDDALVKLEPRPGRKVPEWPGLDQDALTDTNLSVVHWAAMRDTPEILEKIFSGTQGPRITQSKDIFVWSSQAQQNQKTPYLTPLHYASMIGNVDSVKVLCRFLSQAHPQPRVWLERPDHFGDTALQVAAMYGQLDVIKILLREGASERDCMDSTVTLYWHQRELLSEANRALLVERRRERKDLKRKGKNVRNLASVPKEEDNDVSEAKDDLEHKVKRYGMTLTVVEQQRDLCTTKMKSSGKLLYPVAFADACYRFSLYVFLMVACILATWYHATDNGSYMLVTGISDRVTTEEIAPEIQFFPTTLWETDTVGKFWEWMNGPILEETIREAWPPDQALRYTLHDDQTTLLVGSVQLRQLRMQTGTCRIRYSPIESCVGDFSGNGEETGDFQGLKWTVDAHTASVESVRTGTLYPDSGYLLYLPTDPDEWTAQIEKLAGDQWIDEQTRAVFLEFVVYSRSTDRFVVVQVMFEIPASGGFWPSIRIGHIRPEVPGWIIAMELLMYICAAGLLFSLLEGFMRVYRQGYGTGHSLKTFFFYQNWNILTLSIIVLIIAGIPLRIILLVQQAKIPSEVFGPEAVEELKKVNIFEIARWEEIYSSMLAFTTMMVTIRMLRYVAQLPKTGPVAMSVVATITHPSTLISLFVIGVFFVGMLLMLHFSLGSQQYRWRSLTSSILGLFRLVLGEWDYDEYESLSPTYGPLFFIAVAFIMVIVLLNILIGVLSVVYEETLNESVRMWAITTVDLYVRYMRMYKMPYVFKICYTSKAMKARRDKNRALISATRVETNQMERQLDEDWGVLKKQTMVKVQALLNQGD